MPFACWRSPRRVRPRSASFRPQVMALEDRTLLATFNVALTGSDTTGTGTAGNPWRSIQFAINQAALVAGPHTLRVAAGTYNQAGVDQGITINSANLAGLQLQGGWNATFTAQTPGTTVYIPQQPSVAGSADVDVFNSNVGINGFQWIFDGTPGAGGSRASSGIFSRSTGLVVGQNTFEVGLGVSGARSYGLVTIGTQTGLTITNNTFFADAGGTGAGEIFLSPDATRVTPVMISGNTFQGSNLTTAIIIDTNGYVTISNNSFLRTAGTFADGLIDLRTRPAVPTAMTNVTIQQNTIDGGGTTAGNSGIRINDNITGTQAVTGVSITNNIIRNNGVGIINIAAVNSLTINNNSIAGNSLLGIFNVAGASTIDASGNWWGSNMRAGVQAAIMGSIDYTPFLNSGTDTQPATPGFQGDFSYLNVDVQSPQVGATGRIQEGVNLVTVNGTVNVLNGTYSEPGAAVSVGKTVTLLGAQAGVDARTRSVPPNPATETILGGNAGFLLSADNIVLDGWDISVTSAGFGTGVDLSAANSGYRIVNDIFYDNQLGLYLNSSGAIQTVVQRNLFQDNNQPGAAGGNAIYGGDVGNSSNILIDNNWFIGNQGAAVNLNAYNGGLLDRLTISNNQVLSDSNALGGTAGNGFVLFGPTNSTITGNTITGTAGSEVFLGPCYGPDPNVQPNNITITGNSFLNGSTNGIRIDSDGGPGTPYPLHSINLAPGAITINCNRISGNASAGLRFNGLGTINATNNWWGSATGPNDPVNNPAGTGDKVVATGGAVVNDVPFAGVPDCCANIATTTAPTNATTTFSASAQTIVLTGIVTRTGGGGPVNGGFFSFTVAGIGSTTSVTVVNGSATANLTIPAGQMAGSYTITTTYNGDGVNFRSSSDNTGKLIINPVGTPATTTAPTFATVTFSSSPQTITLTGMVTSGAGPVNGGNFTFFVGSFVPAISGTVANGMATAVFTLPGGAAAGVYPITTVYSGAVGFGSSSDNTGRLTVNPAPIPPVIVPPPPPRLAGGYFATGTDAGGAPEVKLFVNGVLRLDFFAYNPAFTGGVRVATGDVNGDGIPDLLTVPGPGMLPEVKVFDGRSGILIRDFFAGFTFNPLFLGGAFVAAGDVNHDRFADIVVSADAGGLPELKAFSGASGAVLYDFFAYSPFFSGGVRVAVGDINGDGYGDIITGAGPGGTPEVRAYNGRGGAPMLRFLAYDPSFSGGVFVAAGDVNGDGKAEIITGPGLFGRPEVRVFTSATLLQDFIAYPAAGSTGQIAEIPTSSAGRSGLHVAAVDFNGDGRLDILTGPGPGQQPEVKIFDALSLAVLDDFFAYNPNFMGGVFVGGRS